MNKETVYIQSKTKPDNPKKSLKFNDKWHEVKGNAVQYFDKVNYKENWEVGVEDGKVVFIGSKSDSCSQPNDNTQERIMRTACFNMASRVVAGMQINGEKREVLYARAIRNYAEEIHRELLGFLQTEYTEDGIEIPMKEVGSK